MRMTREDDVHAYVKMLLLIIDSITTPANDDIFRDDVLDECLKALEYLYDTYPDIKRLPIDSGLISLVVRRVSEHSLLTQERRDALVKKLNKVL